MANQDRMSELAKAKTRMLMRHVFFATVLMNTPLIEDRSIPTAATDMTHIYYNPDFLEGLSDTKIVIFVLAHEVMHIVLRHGFRRGGRDPALWNIACDHAINNILKAETTSDGKPAFMLWEKCHCDERFKGMSAEEIYAILSREGGRGKSKPKSKSKPKPDGIGDDLMPTDQVSPAEKSRIEQQIISKVAQGHNIAQMQGQMGGELDRLVKGVLKPPLPWNELFREFFTERVRDEETWSTRDRRFPHIYLPGVTGFAMGEVVVIGDTSGSMPDKVYPQVEAEINAMMESVHPERVRVIWADDTECAREEVFEEGEPVVLHPKGFGGTDMRKPLKFVERYDPLVVVLVTDCFTPWGEAPPPYPLITVSTTKGESCPWGRTVNWNA